MSTDPLPRQLHEQRIGAACALAAFTFWGLTPVYFKWLGQVGPWEIIAHRIVWAAPLLAAFLLLRDGRAFFSKLRLPGKTMAGLLLTGLLVMLNWLVFVWAVVNGHVLATSLGYFINPLVNVLLGFVFLHERLSGVQATAVTIAAAGTAYLAWFLGQAPWISLWLGFSFGFYGLVRKRMSVGPLTGLMWEVLLLLPPAVVYLLWRAVAGELDFLAGSPRIDVLLSMAGLVTILPLIGFNIAARTLSLTVVGFYQYLAPTMTFLLAVFLWDEPFTRGHAVAFTCIWVGLAAVSAESLRSLQRDRRHGLGHA